MVQVVNALLWKDTPDEHAPVAPYSVDFSIDPVWQFTLMGSYLNSPIAPRGVTVSNAQNPAAIMVQVGPTATLIPGFQTVNVAIPIDSTIFSLSCTTAQTVPILFWYAGPPSGNLVNQYSTQVSGNQSSPGVFTNTQMNQPYTFALGGINFTVEYQAAQGANFSTDALAGGIAVPSSSTVYGANAVAGYANSASTTTNTTAGYFQMRTLANGVRGWGINPLVEDQGFAATIQCIEADLNSSNLMTSGAVIDCVMDLSAGNHASLFGISIQTHGGQVGIAIAVQDGATGIGMIIGAVAAAANSDSAFFVLNARDGGNNSAESTIHARARAVGSDLILSPDGGLVEITAPLALQGYTVGTLPAAGSFPGCVVYVTDANAPTWGNVLAGGGGTFCLAVSDGANWTAR